MAVQIFDRCEAGKDSKVSYEMRLVSVSAVSRKDRPVDVRRFATDPRQGVLESPDTAEEFWRHRHFGLEQLDEATFAEADRAGNLSRARSWLRAAEHSEGGNHFAVMALTTSQSSEQPVLEHAKPVRGIGAFDQLAVDLGTAGTADIVQIDVALAGLTTRKSQKGQSTAQPEVDAEDGRLLGGVGDEGYR
jgi:hypothetical protein